jgi:ribonuclease Z
MDREEEMFKNFDKSKFSIRRVGLKGPHRRGFLESLFGGAVALSVAGELPAKESHSAIEDFSRGMHVVITGSGSALIDPYRGNASQAVIVDGQIIQFDCGRKAMDNLALVGINPVDVDFLFFTHLHFDHIATYDYFVISSWIAGRREPFRVFGPRGTREMSESAIFGMHKVDLKFIRHLIRSWPDEGTQPPVDQPPVDVRDCDAGLIVENDRFRVTAIETSHYRSMGVRSLGYRVDCDWGSVVISGDTAPSSELTELARGADLLIHECVIPDPSMTEGGKFNATGGKKGRPEGHTSPAQLGAIAEKAGVKKLVATHLPPYTSSAGAVAMSQKYYGSRRGPEIWDEFLASMRRHYRGPVILASDGLILRIGE